MRSICLLLPALVTAYPYFHSGNAVQPDTRSLDEIYQAALKEGGIVTLWHGGDEKNQQDGLKSAFEKRFPGMTLNVTVDLSKYLDIEIDQQLARNDLYVDIAMLQTLQDYPRWKEAGALAPYKPIEFSSIYDQIVDIEGYYMGVRFFHWPLSWDSSRIQGSGPIGYDDFLSKDYKNKLVLTYPNDDDAVMHNFNQILREKGTSWFDRLLEQNPRWVRGTQTPTDLISAPNSTLTATFAAFGPFGPPSSLKATIPTTDHFTSWAQTGAIFAAAPHPQAARLLMNFVISQEWQKVLLKNGWSIRKDLPPPAGQTQSLLDMQNTDPLGFRDFMMDRVSVERLRFWYEQRLGPAVGVDPVDDDM